MVILTSCLIWQIISFILPPNEILGKKIIFWSWRICKQGKLSHLWHKKPARINWKVDAPKTNYWFWSRSIIEPFFSKMSKERPLQSIAIVIGPFWTNFCSQKFKRRILAIFGFKYVPHTRSYTRCFTPCFWRSHYQPQSWCRCATSELRFDTVGLLFVRCRQR